MWSDDDSEEDSGLSDDEVVEFQPLPLSGEVRVLSAFEFPKPHWNEHRRIFQLVEEKGPLNGAAASKLQLFRERYSTVLQRVKRNAAFNNSRDGYNVTTVDALIGSPGRKYVVGLLTQLREGAYHLEDPNGTVPLALDGANFSPGLYTEGALVIAEGEYSDGDGLFRVHALGMPPSESRKESHQILGNVDLFMPPIVKTAKTKYSKFFDVEEEAMDMEMPEGAEIVILAEVHLDKFEVLQKLRELFSNYDDQPPAMFILMGNFSSCQSALANNVKQLKESFEKLAAMVVDFPSIARSSRFVFLPGPTDPGGEVVNILPKHPLPKVFTDSFRARVPNSHFLSNPARIRFYGQDLVIFRQNLVNKMHRNCIREPVDDEHTTELPQHLVKTIADQSQLCPLPLSVQPVYWNYSHAMSLYPLPDAVVLGDKYDQFEHTYDGCLFFNTGSFTTDYSFMVYMPHTKQTEFSRIDD